MSDSFQDIGDSPFEGTAANPKLALFFPRHSELVSSLQGYSIESTTRLIGGMLTMPEFQASTIRLEVLQHLIVGCCTGTSEAKPPDIAAWLTDLGGGYAGMLEDPVEDVFVSRVSGPEADYLVFEGVYEAGGYCLQRFLNVLQTMPAEEPFAALNRSALALLRLADEVATRADLSAHMVGVEQPLEDVPLDLIERAVGSANRVSFASEEITALGIREEDLEPFVFDLDAAHVLRAERVGNSSLERWPLFRIGESYIFALPSAVSMAIRRLIIEVCISAGEAEELYQAYAKEVAASVADTPLLSGAGAGNMPFHRVAGIFVCNMARYVDQGRLLHLCFLVDDFAGYEESGVVDPRPGTDIYGKIVGESIQHIADSVENESELREAITLVVLCSWGRPIATEIDSADDARWRIESISAADLEALSWASAFSPHKLWSLLDAQDALAAMDVELLNVNGLLNLFAWSEQLDGHLVPHGDLPDESSGGPLVIFGQQNSLLDIRRRGAQTWDVHRARTPDGTLVQVRRLREDSIFAEDRDKPLYASFDDVKEGRLVAVYKTARRGWWLTTECPDTLDRDLQWRLWHALSTWLERSADLLEAQYPALPVGAIAWQCVFEDEGLSDPGATIPNEEEARRLIRVETDGNTVRVIARRGYLLSFRIAKNIGERLLIDAFVRGTASLTDCDYDEATIAELLQVIVPNEWARDMHLFTARTFRDFVGRGETGNPILIDPADDALFRLGLGWRSRDRDEGARVTGVEQCCAYLNQVIDDIWEEIKEELGRYAREPLLRMLIGNHESIVIETDRWSRTARAVLAFRQNKGEAARESAQHVAKLNGASLATRILIEMVLCDCPAQGELPGRIDISRLMVKVMQMHHLGGWSEAIRYRGKVDEIRITPLGDIHTHTEFDSQVATPYGMALGVKRLEHGADRYEENFREVDPLQTARGKLDDAFWDAWEQTFGFTIDELRVFMDNLDDEGVRREGLVFTAGAEEIESYSTHSRLPHDVVRNILELLALRPRSTWASTPKGFLARDWYPWRFRRRLSVISRPIIQLTDDSRGDYLVAPGLVRDGVAKVLDYCYRGGYDARDVPEGALRQWIGSVENERGHRFNRDVAERLHECGWEVRHDIKLTEILNRKLDRNFGDVDVLAWKDSRVVAVECKDLELAMTSSDVARQLHDFLGEIKTSGKPDRLKKHLLRVDVLREGIEDVAKFVDASGPIIIDAALVFSDVVPMHFSGLARHRNVTILTSDELDQL